MDYIYKFDTDNGFEQTDISSFYDVIEDDDFYLMYLGKASFIDFAKTYNLDDAIIDLLLSDTAKKSYMAVEDNYTFAILELLDIMGNLETSDLIGFYIENNRLIIVDLYDRDQSTTEAFRKMLTKKFSARSPGDDDDIKHLKSVLFRVERYSSNISYLSGYITNVKDSYTSKMDLSMNNTMKVLTVVTTIFTPITIITGWYGMNFENMPELKWNFGYIYVMGISLCSVILVYLLFRRFDRWKEK